ncbi:hypothetical protein V2J09_019945 [Rumex salicifolius]
MEEEDEETIPIHGDLLEATLAFVPLLHLIPICRVSKSWRRAVFSSLSNFNKIKPWFLIHVQNKFSSEPKTTFGYDPRSDIWIQIDQPLTKYVSTLRSSGSNFLYMLSSSTLSFSTDPLHMTWRQVDSPGICRIDPIVAVCGNRIVVAGSGWDFEDDTLAVEVYDHDSSTWKRCHSMPDILKDSAAATWLSVAANHCEMFVTEKASGTTYSFDPSTGIWRGPYNLRPDPRVFFTAVGFVGDDLIVVGLVGHAGIPESLMIWKVNRDTMDCELIGEAPPEIVEKLKSERVSLRQIELSPAENFVYIYNPLEPAELVYCEFAAAGGDCVWGSARNPMSNEYVKIGARMVFSCGSVGLEDLQMAMRSENRRFLVVE